MVANIMPADPLPPPPPPRPSDPGGQKVKIQLFSEHGHIAYKIKGNHECSNMVAIILPTAPPTDPRVKRSNLTFAEHDHVAYQIKGNRECSNMVANILPAAPSPLRRSKFNFFRTWSCCTSKESRMQQHGSNCRQRYNKYETYQT